MHGSSPRTNIYDRPYIPFDVTFIRRRLAMPSRFDNKSPDKDSMTPEDVTDKEELYFEKKTADGRIVLTEDAAYEATAFAYSSPKKWYILTVIAFIQYSMNFNTSGKAFCVFQTFLMFERSLFKRRRRHVRRMEHLSTSSSCRTDDIPCCLCFRWVVVYIIEYC